MRRELGRVSNFHQSINWHHHMKDHVESSHLTMFDAFRINIRQVTDLYILFLVVVIIIIIIIIIYLFFINFIEYLFLQTWILHVFGKKNSEILLLKKLFNIIIIIIITGITLMSKPNKIIVLLLSLSLSLSLPLSLSLLLLWCQNIICLISKSLPNTQ